LTWSRTPSRPDAGIKVTGAARYTEDIRHEDLLFAAAVRSPLAAARIIRVGVDAARAADGVHAVLTADDLPDRRWGTLIQDQPIPARDAVRFAGEPIALIAAETAAAARAAAARVELELEPTEPVVGIAAAFKDGAPEVIPGRPNVGPVARVRRGDVDAAFRDATHVVRTRIESGRVYQGYIEPRATLAEPEPDGGIIVTTTSEAPFVVRAGLAALLDLPMSKVVVKVPVLGGGFGGKLHLGLAPLAAVLCQATGRPVRIVATREEDMHACNPRQNSVVALESAVDADGTILARRSRVWLDSGAYAFDTPAIASLATLLATGPYRAPALDLQTWPVYRRTPARPVRHALRPARRWCTPTRRTSPTSPTRSASMPSRFAAATFARGRSRAIRRATQRCRHRGLRGRGHRPHRAMATGERGHVAETRVRDRLRLVDDDGNALGRDRRDERGRHGHALDRRD